MAEDGAAAAAILDQDVGEPALGAADAQQVRFDATFAEIPLVQLAVVVGTCRTDVTATQSPDGGRNYSCCNLSAQAHFAMNRIGFAVARGEVLEAQDDVGGIFADAGEVHEGNRHEGEAYLNSLKNQKEENIPGFASYNLLSRGAVVNRVFLSL
jgi:hypothetical protein